MEKKGIFIYQSDCDDFTTTGMVGDIRPIQAIFHEEKNGLSEVELRLTYDEYERWKAAKPGNYIKCEVPVRVPPVISEDQYANTVQVQEPT